MWSMQSTGHGVGLHDFVSTLLGHAVPPCFAACVTVCVRNVVPLPHVALHVDHEDQVPVQCTGHFASSHSRTSESAPHVTPPFSGSTAAWCVKVL